METGRTKRPSLTMMIITGLVCGFAWGLFFGELGAGVKWIGDAYVGLLQMTVLPFVALSLTANVGRLSPQQGGRLARVAASVLVVLWAIGLLTMVVMSASFPSWEAGSFFSTSLVEEPEQPDWLALFIPANPFWALTYNLVPAVVLFSLGLGVALMSVPNKELLLDKLDVATEGLARLNKMVVNLSPIGIFGIVGHASGTMSLQQFGLVQGYLVVYGAAAILLSLWILPALIAACTPFTHREVLSASRDTLITAFVIGNTFVVLPLIVDAVKRLSALRNSPASQSDHTPEYFVPMSYPFPDVGRIVGLIFIPFAAWFYGMSIDPSLYPQLLGVGFVGAFAKPVVTVPLLLNVAEIPSDIFNLYLSVGVVAARFGDIMKAMHLMAFSILTACALSGTLKIRMQSLAVRGATTVLLTAATVFALQGFLDLSFKGAYSKEKLVTARHLLLPQVEAEMLTEACRNPVPFEPEEDPIERVRRRGVIRIGFEPDELPFAYFNQERQLVGFDIDMAHQLATDLGVRIEFVPCSSDVAQSLREDYFDVAMSGFEGTVRRAAELPHVPPYLDVNLALIVPDHRRSEFRSREHIRSQPGLRLAVVAEGAAAELADVLPANIEVVEIETERDFFVADPPLADALAISAEAGSAWTLEYPQFAVVKPEGLDISVPLYYLVEKESQFEEFLENWLALKHRDGSIDRLYDYWILGRDEKSESSRWCVIRNVLHWIK